MVMKNVRKRLLRVLFAIEIVGFSYLYFFGNDGLRAVKKLQAERDSIAAQVAHIKYDIAALDRDIASWQTDPFYKEKCAREQLHMARRGEEVYYTS